MNGRVDFTRPPRGAVEPQPGEAAGVSWGERYHLQSPAEPVGAKLFNEGKYTMAMRIPDGRGNLIPMEASAQKLLFAKIYEAAKGAVDDLQYVSGFSIFKDKIRLFIYRGGKRPVEEKEIPFAGEDEQLDFADNPPETQLDGQIQHRFGDTIRFCPSGIDFSRFKREHEEGVENHMNVALDLRPRKGKMPSDLRGLLSLLIAAHGRDLIADNHRTVIQKMDQELGWGERAEAGRRHRGAEGGQ
jgi:hypothetical protein